MWWDQKKLFTSPTNPPNCIKESGCLAHLQRAQGKVKLDGPPPKAGREKKVMTKKNLETFSL